MKRLFATAVLLLISVSLHGGSVIGSRHDLSTTNTPQVCEFCHTPHLASTNIQAPLWNRAETTQSFLLYGSPTINAAIAQPRAVSRLCLSCHDGVAAKTVVDGKAVHTKHEVIKPTGHPNDTSSWPNCERCHTDSWKTGRRRVLILGTNLSNDHPISMPYPTPAQDAGFKTPPDAVKGWGGTSPNDVKLYEGWVECGSCHNVHDPVTQPFLRKSNAASALCLTCHSK